MSINYNPIKFSIGFNPDTRFGGTIQYSTPSYIDTTAASATSSAPPSTTSSAKSSMSLPPPPPPPPPPSPPTSSTPVSSAALGVRQEHLYNSSFFEKQESLGCGRHALNNLLGRQYFVKEYTPPRAITEAELLTLHTTPPISLQSLCRLLSTKYNLYGGCPSNENYNIHILQAALDVIGHESREIWDKTTNTFATTTPVTINTLGYLINYGGGHYVSLRKESNNQFLYNDSMGKSNESFPTVDKYLTKYTDSRIYSILQIDNYTTYIDPNLKLGVIGGTDPVSKEQNKQAAELQRLRDDLLALVNRYIIPILGDDPKTVAGVLINLIVQDMGNPNDGYAFIDIIDKNKKTIGKIVLDNQDKIIKLSTDKVDTFQKFVSTLSSFIAEPNAPFSSSSSSSTIQPAATSSAALFKDQLTTLISNDSNLIFTKIKTHQIQRFEELYNLLLTNKDVRVMIPTETIPANQTSENNILSKKIFHGLGSGLARGQWGDKVLSNANLQNLSSMIQVLVTNYGERIQFGSIGPAPGKAPFFVKEGPSCKLLHLWGANINNWDLPDSTMISGGGQAAVIGKQIPGVFGIITTPLGMDPSNIINVSTKNHACPPKGGRRRTRSNRLNQRKRTRKQ
jgi:hypothetical protein